MDEEELQRVIMSLSGAGAGSSSLSQTTPVRPDATRVAQEGGPSARPQLRDIVKKTGDFLSPGKVLFDQEAPEEDAIGPIPPGVLNKIPLSVRNKLTPKGPLADRLGKALNIASGITPADVSGGPLIASATVAKLAKAGKLSGRVADLRAILQGFRTRAYHATNSHDIFEETTPFFWGSHFGSKEAAIDRLTQLQEIARVRVGGKEQILRLDPSGLESPIRTIPVRLRGNFVEVEDHGMWNTAQVLEDLVQRGHLSEIEKAAIHVELGDLRKAMGTVLPSGGPFYGNAYLGESRPYAQAATKLVGSVLKEKGIDGFHYVNMSEDVGSVSYMVFDPVNIRSIFANFDPAKTDVADLMAAIGAVSVLGASHFGLDKEEEK